MIQTFFFLGGQGVVFEAGAVGMKHGGVLVVPEPPGEGADFVIGTGGEYGIRPGEGSFAEVEQQVICGHLHGRAGRDWRGGLPERAEFRGGAGGAPEEQAAFQRPDGHGHAGEAFKNIFAAGAESGTGGIRRGDGKSGAVREFQPVKRLREVGAEFREGEAAGRSGRLHDGNRC